MLNRLTALAVKSAKPGRHSDGGGLYLVKTEGGGNWLFRYSFGGRRRDMGIGRISDVSLAQARAERDRWASMLALGRDPISEREAERQAAAEALSRVEPSVEDLVRIVFDARKGSMKADGAAGRWLSPFTAHLFPRIGARRAREITTADLLSVFRSLWLDKPNVALKLFTRMRLVWSKGQLLGYGTDPITVELVKEMLGEIRERAEPIAHTPWQEIPALFDKLANEYGDRPGRMCLRWIILTAVRSQSARGARFSEVDGDVWTVPAERMKGTMRTASDFRVPLSPPALDIMELARSLADDPVNGFMFPGQRSDRMLSQNALLNILNDMGETGRPHGFRSSFRTWVQDTDATSYDVAETALAHVVGRKVERSYARSDLLDRRRILMSAWADHVTGNSAKVVPIRTG